jgi:sulfur transfer protein SufE
MKIEDLIIEFDNNKSWDKRYRLIIQLGKKLAPFPEEKKTLEYQIDGCESVAWFHSFLDDDRVYFQMDSDARIVKGLMMILQIIFQGKTSSEIKEIDHHFIFGKLGLLQHLSPSRTNGLLAIVKKMKGEAGA